ncbi:MAG: hypothetical protein JW885_04995 [Deltaproteobacteria bacterium]|nr:hypothetical protein [Candidatus Zymogenaceae bacterium]
MFRNIIVTGLLAGLAMLAVEMGLAFLSNLVLPGLMAEYANIWLFRAWNDPLMSIYFAYPFVMGLALAWFWNRVKSTFRGKSAWGRGALYGFAYWIIATIPGMVITYSSFQISFPMVLTWTVSGLIGAVAGGLVCAGMNR